MSLTPVLLGLGSNSQRQKNLTAGLDALSMLLTDMQCSPVFESLPVGIRSDHFYNLVVSGYTSMELSEFDRKLKFIEADNGRYAPDRVGLPLDIDVLLYGQAEGDFHGLILPRPELLKNAFVLWPAALLQPDWVHPQQQQTLAALWRESRIQQALWPVSFEWHQQPLTPRLLCEAHPAPLLGA